MMRWKAHKSTIRGELIANSAKQRKDRQAHIIKLTSCIQELECAHKTSQALVSLPDLLQARTNLLEALNKQTKQNYILSQKLFYKYGNKSGKLLARALRAKKASMTIHSLTDAKGQKILSNDQIADQFVQYYTQLYNLHPTSPQMEETQRTKSVRDFLMKYSPEPLSNEAASDLEQPISPTEINTVLKQLKPGKSPGPDGLTTGYYKTFIETLKPHFLTAFNSLSSDNPAPTSRPTNSTHNCNP